MELFNKIKQYKFTILFIIFTILINIIQYLTYGFQINETVNLLTLFTLIIDGFLAVGFFGWVGGKIMDELQGF